MSCPMCGDEAACGEERRACRTCPLAKDCQLLRCPRCGYEWVEESRLVNWLKERWQAWRGAERHDGAR